MQIQAFNPWCLPFFQLCPLEVHEDTTWLPWAITLPDGMSLPLPMPPLSLGNGFKAENLELLLPTTVYQFTRPFIPSQAFKIASESWICTKILSVGKENGSIWMWIFLTGSWFVVASFPLPEREKEDLHGSKADGRSKNYCVISRWCNKMKMFQWSVEQQNC